MVELPERIRRRIGAAVLASVVLLAVSAAGAQGSRWPAYGRMACHELESERQSLRRELARMQRPDAIDDARWTPAFNAHIAVNHFFSQKCRVLSAQERNPPEPPQIALMPEKQHVELALKAHRNGRTGFARGLLAQGALAGYASAQFNLGMLLYLGGDAEASERWLRSAAQQGHREAAEMLQSMRTPRK